MLVPPRDAEALAEALHTILESPDRQKKMGARSREIVQEDFSVERVNEKTLALYEKLERQS
jgi:glycosyltransferase involved in cell wall biosynthesis